MRDISASFDPDSKDWSIMAQTTRGFEWLAVLYPGARVLCDGARVVESLAELKRVKLTISKI